MSNDTYALSAELTIQNDPYALPGLDSNLFRVRMFRRNYSGPVTTVALGGDEPFILELLNKEDKQAVGLQAHQLTINLIVDGSFSARIFHVVEDFDVQVRLEQVNRSGDVSETPFVGWLVNIQLKEPVAAPPYNLVLTATCGLPLLKNRPLLTADGRYPDANISHRDVLLGGLALLRSGLKLVTICNLRETADRTPDRINLDIDVLQQDYLPADAFRGASSYQSAADALQALCVAYRANLRQCNGEWYFYRVNELRGGWVPFSALGPVGATDSFTRHIDPDTGQLIGSVTNYQTAVKVTGLTVSDPTIRVESGAVVTLQQTEPIVSVAQTFGESVSQLLNGSFANLSNGFAANWQRLGDADTVQRLGNGSPLDPFRIRIKGVASNAYQLNWPIVIGAVQVVTFFDRAKNVIPYPRGGVPMRVTGRFKGQGFRGAKVLIFGVWGGFKENESYALLNEAGQWVFDPSRGQMNAIEIPHFAIQRTGDSASNNKPLTKAGEGEIDIRIPVRKDGSLLYQLHIYLCQATRHLQIDKDGNETTDPLSPYPADPYIDYEALRVTVGDPQKQTTGQTITFTNFKRLDNDGVLEQPVTPVRILSVGDLPSAITTPTTHGFLSRLTPGSPFSLANRYDRPRNAVSTGTSKSLVTWVALEEAAQVSRPHNLFEGTLIGRLPYGPLSVLKIIGQAGVDGPDSCYQLVGWRWNLRFQTHEVVALEVLRDSTPLSVTATWQTPDGDFAQDFDPLTAVDIPGGVYPNPLPPKKPGRIGGGSIREIIDQLQQPPVPKLIPVLNSESAPGAGLSPVYPLSRQDQTDGMGEISIYKDGQLLARSGFTGRAITQLINPNDYD